MPKKDHTEQQILRCGTTLPDGLQTMNDDEVTPFRRRILPQPHSYPHVYKIQRNLYGILAIASSLDLIEPELLEKKRLPQRSGPVPLYPNPGNVVSDYALLLEETLVETAVFIRAHDEFWKAKEGVGWSKLLKRKCGTVRYLEGNPELIDMALKGACDKIVHHTGFDIGWIAKPSNFCASLFGSKNKRRWCAELDVKEFCLIGMTYVR